MALHAGEVPVDEDVVGTLIAAQRPDLAGLDVRRLGGGTDNTMFRVGDGLLARMPRTPHHVEPLRKELTWLPRFAGLLPCAVPRPILVGEPEAEYSLHWALLDWLDGEQAGLATVRDWATYGRDLAGVVSALHAAHGMNAVRSDDLAGYRGGSLRPLALQVEASLAEVERMDEPDLDLAALRMCWARALALPDPRGPEVWLHTDLKPSNVLVCNGRLSAVIDFGGLCRGIPDAEHAAVWDLPVAAREAYRDVLAIDDATWARARGWATMIGLVGLPYYRRTFPAFAAECRARLRAIAGSEPSA